MLFITTLANYLNAQEVKFGVKGGLNTAFLINNTNDGLDKNPRIGFHIGGLTEIPLTDRLSIQPELLFSQQ